MRLVKIKLSPHTPFWFLGDIVSLSKESPVSPLINVDSLEEEQVKTINHSVRQLEVKLFDGEGNKIKKIDQARFVNGEYSVDTNDTEEEDKDNFEGIESVTISDEPEEVKEEIISVQEEDLKEASVFLNRNGNTVRKMILNMPKSKDNLVLLHACLQVESSSKARAGVIKRLEEAIDEYKE
jgi:hypothetical protein